MTPPHHGRLTDIAGVRVGHWTGGGSGCTVVVLPAGTVASAEVRGGAPATRELDLLQPGRLVERLDAVVLTGGSAFGLATADGVMQHLAEAGVGFATAGGPVPIVVAMAIFDLTVAQVRPGAAQGRAAAAAAAVAPHAVGRVGAGTGATVGKWRGRDLAIPGGLGAATMASGEVLVSALVVVNASGDVDDGITAAEVRRGAFVPPEVVPFENTTLAVVVTNARLDKVACHAVAQSAHDGFARALLPVHTLGDGDAAVAAATGEVTAELATVRLLATIAVDDAIRSAVTSVPPTPGTL
jgi:L-aminopeptidase/D-esterase-like protein